MDDSNKTSPDNISAQPAISHSDKERYQQGLLLARALGTHMPGLITGDFNMQFDKAASEVPSGSLEVDFTWHEVESAEARERRLFAFNCQRSTDPLDFRSGAEHEFCCDNLALLLIFAQENGIPLPDIDVPPTNP